MISLYHLIFNPHYISSVFPKCLIMVDVVKLRVRPGAHTALCIYALA